MKHDDDGILFGFTRSRRVHKMWMNSERKAAGMQEYMILRRSSPDDDDGEKGGGMNIGSYV